MLPAVALVGRPNVGKSTLFNRLTATRDALVADYPGLYARPALRRRARGRPQVHRDRHGGLVSGGADAMTTLVAEQVEIAIEEADAVVLVVDHKSGLTPEDVMIAERLRRESKPVVIAVNKAEGVPNELAEAEFHSVDLARPSASRPRGQGVDRCCAPRCVVSGRRRNRSDCGDRARAEGRRHRAAERRQVDVDQPPARREPLITSPEPGTTRDSVNVPVERDDKKFVLVDTAGIRRRARVSEAIEKYSVVQSLKAIEEAGAVIAVLDARENVTDQDVHLVGLAAERGHARSRSPSTSGTDYRNERRFVEREVERKLDFVPYASQHYISALHGSGIAELIKAALSATRMPESSSQRRA